LTKGFRDIEKHVLKTCPGVYKLLKNAVLPPGRAVRPATRKLRLQRILLALGLLAGTLNRGKIMALQQLIGTSLYAAGTSAEAFKLLNRLGLTTSASTARREFHAYREKKRSWLQSEYASLRNLIWCLDNIDNNAYARTPTTDSGRYAGQHWTIFKVNMLPDAPPTSVSEMKASITSLQDARDFFFPQVASGPDLPVEDYVVQMKSEELALVANLQGIVVHTLQAGCLLGEQISDPGSYRRAPPQFAPPPMIPISGGILPRALNNPTDSAAVLDDICKMMGLNKDTYFDYKLPDGASAAPTKSKIAAPASVPPVRQSQRTAAGLSQPLDVASLLAPVTAALNNNDHITANKLADNVLASLSGQKRAVACLEVAKLLELANQDKQAIVLCEGAIKGSGPDVVLQVSAWVHKSRLHLKSEEYRPMVEAALQALHLIRSCQEHSSLPLHVLSVVREAYVVVRRYRLAGRLNICADEGACNS
jgi:hypothetical protein